MVDYDVLIVGAGVIGLGIASELSSKGMSILLVERHSSFGNETSSRNSEVIHSGIYYETSSLKAKLCVEGSKLLYDWCNKYHVPYSKTGKFIIAIEEEEEESLFRLKKNGEDNGVEGLRITSSHEVMSKNPGVTCISALYSPNSGIIDSHKLMYSFLSLATKGNCDILYNHSAVKIDKKSSHYETTLKTTDGEVYNVSTEYVINAAGLDADLLAECSGIDIDKFNYRVTYVKGHYFRLRTGLSVIASNLIYPVTPVNFTGLGVHITLDLTGGLKLGPDVNYLENRVQDYSISENFQDVFFQSAKRYLPSLRFDDLSPDQAGIRPKLQKMDQPVKDFIINEESSKGFPKLINLIGIESPGLTSCIAIAKYISNNYI
jgi:L-2-hydroxyglutarate oxidase LhgO